MIDLENDKTCQEETPLANIIEVEDIWRLLAPPFILLPCVLAAQGDRTYNDFCVDECG